MKSLAVVLLCVFLSFSASAQIKNRIDSVKREVRTTSGAKKAENLNKLARAFSNVNLDSAILYANKTISYATPLKFHEHIATAYNYLGQFMYQRSDYKASLNYFEKFTAAATLANDKVLLAQALNNVASVFIDIGKTDEAIKKFNEVLILAKSNNDQKGMSMAYGNLAYVYRYIGDNTKAIPYIFEEIKIDEAIKNNSGLAYSYQQLAVLYLQKEDYPNAKKYLEISLSKFKALTDGRNVAVNHDLFSTYYSGIKDNKRAIEQEQLAIAEADKYGDKRSVAIFSSKLGDLFYKDETYELAAKNYLIAIDLHEQIKLQKTIAATYIGYGRSILKLNKTEQAKANLDKGLAVAISLKSAVDKKLAYEGLTEYYIKVNQPEKALQFQSKFIGIKDSLLNDNNSKQINELNTRYETQKKQQQILLLNSANKIQGLELNRNKLELLTKSLENDKNVFRIGTQQLLLEKNRIQLAKTQLETKAKAQKIKLLATENELQRLELLKRNIWLGIIIAVLLMLSLLGYLFYNRYKLKQEARLHAEVLAQQDLATKAVLNAEENERKRISGELHDGLGQMFSAVKMNLSALTDGLNFKDKHTQDMFGKTINLVDESCKEVRVISHQMAPNVLLKSGLATAVRDFVSKIDSRKLKINLETFGLQERLDQNIETVLYRVIQETVNNVIKHSGANTLDIQLSKDDDGINAMIEDNGDGFDITQLEKFEGIGLKNIRTRVNYLKGTVDFSSSPGQGTLVAIFIPLRG